MIAFKQHLTIEEWKDFHPTLKALLVWLANRWPGDFMVVTRAFDPAVIGESGVHRQSPHRAADVRTNNMTIAQGESLETMVNITWDYGDGKHRVAWQHGEGDERHLHLQVRDETKERSV